MGDIISGVVLPEAWVDRVLAQVYLAGEAERVEKEKDGVNEQLRRLGLVG